MKLTFILWTIVVVWGHYVHSQSEVVQYEEFVNQPGIYLEEVGRAFLSHDEWKLVLFYDLNNYWKEWEGITATMEQLEQRCSQKFGNGTGESVNGVERACKSLYESLEFIIDGVRDRNVLLQVAPSRKKRAPLEFIGTFMNEAFGVLDQRAAVQYESKIRELQEGELRMEELIKQQTHVLDVTTNLVRRQRDEIIIQYNEIRAAMVTLATRVEVSEIALQILTHISLYKEVQEAMIDVLVDLHQGHINPKLVTPTQLRVQLQEMKKWVPADVQVPDYQRHWVQLYQVIRVRARMVNNYLIFELNIPLLGQENFQVYRVYPVPTQYTDRMAFVQPTTPVILVSIHRTWYYPMQIGDLERCISWGVGQLVCLQRSALYMMQEEDRPCEVRLLQHESQPLTYCKIQTTTARVYVQPLSEPNKWLISLVRQETLDVIYNNSVSQLVIKGSGVVRLPPDCQVKGKTFMVRSHGTHTSEQYMKFLPALNLSQHVLEEPDLLWNDNLDSNVDEMMEAIQQLHEKTSWTRLNLHDVHHYAISGVSAVFLVVMLVLWWKRRQLLQMLYLQRRARDNNASGNGPQRRRRSL